MDVNKKVNEFLRDAQYRIAELSVDIDTSRQNDNSEYEIGEAYDKRSQLLIFMDVLYESFSPIHDGYNYLASWTDKGIVSEIEYLRNVTGMNPMPYLDFAANNVSFADDSTSGGTGNDAHAIHTNIAGEIHGVSEKPNPSNTDILIIEDAANGYVKRRIPLGLLSGSGSAFPKRYEWVATSGQKDFVIPGVLTDEIQYADMLVVNGSLQREGSYTIKSTVVSKDTISFNAGIEAGKIVWLQYYTGLANISYVDQNAGAVADYDAKLKFNKDYYLREHTQTADITFTVDGLVSKFIGKGTTYTINADGTHKFIFSGSYDWYLIGLTDNTALSAGLHKLVFVYEGENRISVAVGDVDEKVENAPQAIKFVSGEFIEWASVSFVSGEFVEDN